jgi:hypothetical protein
MAFRPRSHRVPTVELRRSGPRAVSLALGASFAPLRARNFNKYPSCTLLHRIGREPTADRCTSWRSIHKIKAPIVFGTLDHVLDHEMSPQLHAFLPLHLILTVCVARSMCKGIFLDRGWRFELADD